MKCNVTKPTCSTRVNPLEAPGLAPRVPLESRTTSKGVGGHFFVSSYHRRSIDRHGGGQKQADDRVIDKQNKDVLFENDWLFERNRSRMLGKGVLKLFYALFGLIPSITHNIQ